MFWKVLVLEVKDKYCLAMKEDGSVIRIKKKPEVKEGDTVYIVEGDLYGMENKYNIKRSTVRKFTAIAAAVAVFALVMAIPQFADKACATVSFDGEKSVELKLNKDNEILEAKSYDNTLTEEELDDLKGMDMFEAAETFKSFDSKDGALLVASAPMKDDKDEILEEKIDDMLDDCDSIYLKGDKDDVKEAEKANKSLGIYIIEKAVDDDVLEELYEEASPEELNRFIKKYGNKISVEQKKAILNYKPSRLNDDDEDRDDKYDKDDKYDRDDSRDSDDDKDIKDDSEEDDEKDKPNVNKDESDDKAQDDDEEVEEANDKYQEDDDASDSDEEDD